MGFWDEYEKATAAESGGGGVLCQVQIETGFKVYVAGVPQDESWFACPPGNDKIREDTKVQADAYANRHGADRGGQWGIQIRAFKEDAIARGELVTWKADRFFNTQSWTSACKSVVIPALQQHGIMPPWAGWVTLGFAPDPYWVGKGEAETKDEDGNYVKSRIAYPTRTFASHDEALESITVKAVATGEQIAEQIPFDGTTKSFPDGYSEDDWLECIGSIKKMSANATNAVLAQRFGVTPVWIVEALAT